MNRFSALDDSDNEEQVKPKTAPKETKVNATGSGAAPKTKAEKPLPRKIPGAKPDGGIFAVEENVKKENSRGGGQRGGGTQRRVDPKRDGKKTDGKDGKKRLYEKRSGTGRGREVSRGGRGPHGAGNVKQEAMDAEKDPSKADIEVNTEDAEDVSPEETEEDSSAVAFDDFMVQREAARVKALSLTGREKKANEESVFQFTGKGTRDKEQRSTSKQTLVGNFKFEAPAESRGDRRDDRRDNNRRGGRGDRKSGSGSGSGKSSSGKSGKGQVLNEKDFPVL